MAFNSHDLLAAGASSPPKRSDLVAEEIKRLITAKNLLPGDKLPRESELQSMFSVSKSTMREALKSLEVQGLVKVSTGPGGGGTVVEVPLYTIAEDFSQFANVVPGFYFFVGTTPSGTDPADAPINHSPLYAPDESALDVGLRAMLQATLDFLHPAQD